MLLVEVRDPLKAIKSQLPKWQTREVDMILQVCVRGQGSSFPSVTEPAVSLGHTSPQLGVSHTQTLLHGPTPAPSVAHHLSCTAESPKECLKITIPELQLQRF